MNKICKYLIPSIILLFAGCGERFLDLKRNANQVVPQTVGDYLSVLGNVNLRYTPLDLAFLGADEYYVKDQATLVTGSRFTPFHKNAYVWADDIYEGAEVGDWNDAYQNVMYANLALDVEKLVPSERERVDWIKTRVAARFYRAWNYYHLAQIFCKPYIESTAQSELGLPLRSDYDVTLQFGRSSLQEVYGFILKDLTDALEIAPNDEVLDIYLPGKIATMALLSRVYLTMGAYDKAAVYANQVLSAHSTLVDYNELTGSVTDMYGSYFDRYGKNNQAIIFYNTSPVGGILGGTIFDASESFLNTLSTSDLRKKFFFHSNQDGRTIYIGSYAGEGINEPFTGLSVEEVLLIRAECAVRNGDDDRALKDLNELRKNRYQQISYEPVENVSGLDLLDLVLEERMKELYMRGARWTDLRRLNVEGFNLSVRHTLNGEEFVLSPNSEKWVWPLPDSEVRYNSLQQNSR